MFIKINNNPDGETKTNKKPANGFWNEMKFFKRVDIRRRRKRVEMCGVQCAHTKNKQKISMNWTPTKTWYDYYSPLRSSSSVIFSADQWAVCVHCARKTFVCPFFVFVTLFMGRSYDNAFVIILAGNVQIIKLWRGWCQFCPGTSGHRFEMTFTWHKYYCDYTWLEPDIRHQIQTQIQLGTSQATNLLDETPLCHVRHSCVAIALIQ